LFAELERQLAGQLNAGSVTLVTDPAGVVLDALTRMVDPAGRLALPAALFDRHAWVLHLT
jgi:hypothetical protein